MNSWHRRLHNLPTMLLTSPSFENGAMIPRKFTCDGGNINPELQIQNVPDGAKTLALIVHDPDAPIKDGFAHWVVWNIDPRTMVIKDESVPPGAAEGTNGSGGLGYIGPCPPSGMHRYEFHLYALDAVLHLSREATADDLLLKIKQCLMEETVLVGRYGKN